jgi:hypothetical protein
MFAVFRAAVRFFAVGVAVGFLFAPRAGDETRRMLRERFTAALNSLLEIAALPPVQPDQARTNGHAERRPTKRARTGTDARTSS